MNILHSGRQQPLDRFIPRRSSTEFNALNFSSATNESECPSKNKIIDESHFFVNIARERYFQENYRKSLRLIFSFKNCSVDNENEFSQACSDMIPEWPVEARTKPLLSGLPKLILDLPDLDTDFDKNILDWGQNGYVATIFESEVHLWHPDKKEGMRVIDINGNIAENFIKCNKDGSKFAIALSGSRIAVYNIVENKTISINECVCRLRRSTCFCKIISADWTRSNCLVTGCSNGTLVLWSPTLKYKRFRFKAHLSSIINVALSCKDQYFASSGMDANVSVWKLPGLQLVQDFSFTNPSKALAWHPWRELLLVVSDIDKFRLYNIQNGKRKTSKMFPSHYIENVTFNPKSAELLVSSFDMANDISYLTVMNNLQHVVDEVRCNDCRIPYLLWNDTGTKLGTATTDETFGIWDFFGTSTEQQRREWKLRRNIRTGSLGKSFQNTIR